MKKIALLCLVCIFNVYSADHSMPFENADSEDTEEFDLTNLDLDEMAEFLNALKTNLENQFQVEIDMEDVVDLAKNMFLSSNEFSEEEKEIASCFYDLLLVKLTTKIYDFRSSPKTLGNQHVPISKQRIAGLSKVVKGTLQYLVPDTEDEGMINMLHGVSTFLSHRQ